MEDKLIDESDNSINFMSFTNPENYGNMRLSWDNLANGVAYEEKISVKHVPSTYIDFGLGLLELVKQIKKELNHILLFN